MKLQEKFKIDLRKLQKLFKYRRKLRDFAWKWEKDTRTCTEIAQKEAGISVWCRVKYWLLFIYRWISNNVFNIEKNVYYKWWQMICTNKTNLFRVVVLLLCFPVLRIRLATKMALTGSLRKILLTLLTLTIFVLMVLYWNQNSMRPPSMSEGSGANGLGAGGNGRSTCRNKKDFSSLTDGDWDAL